ncbi:hypothetical protein AB0230_04080 [Microbacterium sp. NPDC089190]|uniref:hypothetical protein n=1 Tax=Microbacterium sp. NPDC089190 TaxID=3155063 RepID=UPI00344BFE28
MSRSRRPWGAVFSGVAAVILAAPTLVFPADSPTEPKLGFLAVGTVVFAVSVVRIRAEGIERTTAPPEEPLTEE